MGNDDEVNAAILEDLGFLYGAVEAPRIYVRLEELLRQYRHQIKSGQPDYVDAGDAILITYGDMVQQEGERPLLTLADFLASHARGLISSVHLLPFYPYSSDDGFSVIDYHQVDPTLGSWEDVAQIGQHFRLMFDAVINHISAQSSWFHRFLADDPQYRDYFVVVEPEADLTAVFRPRALPLLTPVETAAGRKHVWTTFSADQIDLNFRHPDVLLAIVETLLFYAARGAEFIRLDAIGFLWKEIGTSCLHLPQTHRLIQLMRKTLDAVAPRVVLITETNVPHQENISYFGDGTNEAQMVYNFSLPPLTLHAFHTGQAETISHWAEGLVLPSDRVTFFNFLASHDGIGVTPARGILSAAEIERMAQRVLALGGRVSYKNNADGTQSAYELNINYLEALADPERPSGELIVPRFLAAQAIMLALRGVPGIYFHSLFGSQNWPEGVAQTGRFRTINRQKLQRDELAQALADPHSLRARVFNGLAHLLKRRAAEPAFHPNGDQQVLYLHKAVFALWRRSVDGRSRVLCLHNVSRQGQSVLVPTGALPSLAVLTDLVGQGIYRVESDGRLALTLAPYQVMWLKVRA